MSSKKKNVFKCWPMSVSADRTNFCLFWFFWSIANQKKNKKQNKHEFFFKDIFKILLIMYIFFNLRSSISYDYCSYSHRRHSHQENATIAKNSTPPKKTKKKTLFCFLSFFIAFNRLQTISLTCLSILGSIWQWLLLWQQKIVPEVFFFVLPPFHIRIFQMSFLAPQSIRFCHSQTISLWIFW